MKYLTEQEAYQAGRAKGYQIGLIIQSALFILYILITHWLRGLNVLKVLYHSALTYANKNRTRKKDDAEKTVDGIEKR